MTEDHQRLEQTASAVEDLIYMGAIRLDNDKAVLSPQFSNIVPTVMSNMKMGEQAREDEVMKLMYYCLLIYINEHLHLPRSLTVALGSDLEKNRESMESGALMTRYVSILAEIWAQHKKGRTDN